jgi:hypothetical protein
MPPFSTPFATHVMIVAEGLAITIHVVYMYPWTSKFEGHSNADLPTARTSRSTTAGEVRVRTRGMNTHVTHGLEVWNACKELRDSRSKAEPSRAATRLARESPL